MRPPFNAKIGELVTVRGSAGASEAVTITGFYGVQGTSPVEPRPSGLIVDAALVERVAADGAQHVFAARIAVESLDQAVAGVASAAPGSLVLSRRDFNAMLIGAIRSLFGFVIAVAGFALAAGAVLIANAAGLVMVERRREIGVLKAIGYSSRRVLALVGVEFATLGLVAGVCGIAAVAVAFAILNRMEPDALLSLGPWMSIAMIGLTAAIALVSAIAASWTPAQCKPLDVLRQE
jgi:ABC-type antimicrobial peptide transport system permease subunit